MRGTTVAILVICTVACCNAQQFSLADKMRVVTNVRNGVGIPIYFNRDSLHSLVTLKNGYSVNDAVKNQMTIVHVLSNNLLIVGNKDLKDHSRIIEQAQSVNFLWKLSDNLTPASFGHEDDYIILTSKPRAFILGMYKHHVEAVNVYGDLVRVRGNLSDAMPSILQRPDVSYLGKESFDVKEESSVLDLYLGPNQINKVHHDFPLLDGTGIVISLKERHYDVEDLDLRGRHISSLLGASDTSDHATEMATIIAGAGNSFITGRGIASHANITSSNFFNLFPDSETDFSAVNSFLQNHSYGTIVENFYGSLANAYDKQMYQHPDILHVFSSGNSGTSTATSGVYTVVDGYSNLTGNSKMAKNVLIVGSVDTTGNALPFSSRGPTNDGRIKPEIVAFSTVGTSNSSALVSGVAALLQHEYKNQNGIYPESSLVKALLVNSADDVGIPGIDFITGYGNLNAYRSIENLKAGKYFEGSVTQNETKNFVLNLPANARYLKVTLVWTDAPGLINASKPLVNNLDLQITNSDGTILPWILNTTPNASLLTAPATRGVDNTNNIEQITIENPLPEVHTVVIKGSSLISANQKFYVAYQWDLENSFTWSYPTGSDNFPYNGETGTYFYWESTLSATNGDLEVSTDNGNIWKPIAKNLVLKKGYYRWQKPSPLNVEAKARMKVGSTYYETDVFTISRTLVPSLGFNCSDSVLLQWNAIKNVLNYEVMKIDGSYPSLFTATNDTALVIKRNPAVSSYAIETKLPSGKTLLRSPAIDIDRFGGGCFINSFVDESITEAGISLRLELGTTYGVREVFFEHFESGEYVMIHSVSDPTNNVQRFLHVAPLQGVNRYRARIILQNRQEVVSDTVLNYFLTKRPFIVFPNPVVRPKDINIYTARFETVNFTFKLFNANGSLVRTAELRSDREFVSTDGLPPGLYIYKIQGKDVDFSGKIVIK